MSTSRNLQEGLASLIWFSSEGAAQACAALGVEKYDPVYRDLVKAGKRYYETYGEPIGEHDIDELDALAAAKPEAEKAYRAIAKSMRQSVDTLSIPYLCDKAGDIENAAQLREGIRDAAQMLADGKENSLAVAREILVKATDMQETGVFDAGASLFNPQDRNRVFAALDEDKQPFSCGIPEIDKYGFGPARQQLHLYVGLPKSGKSWWLTHLAKRGHMQGLKVLYVSLEMVEHQVSQRLMMSLFSIAKRQAQIEYQTFAHAEEPRFMGVNRGIERIEDSLHWEDPRIRAKVAEMLKDRAHCEEIRVKSFPTNGLSIEGLEAYLDRLENTMGFKPDLLLVDYADIMRLPGGNEIRHQIGTLYKELRRIAVERVMAVATATQAGRSNRAATRLDDTSVSEDYSKIFTADTVLTYNQTSWEHRMNLARLFVAAGRGDQSMYEVLISQAYGIGQYCMDSTMVGAGYTSLLNEKAA